MNWRRWEYSKIKHINRPFDIALAREFNSWWAVLVEMKEAKVSQDGKGKSWLGAHYYEFKDRGPMIRLRYQADEDMWRTLIHEMAHYRAHSHGKKFVNEMALVYEAFKLFWKVKS